MTLALGESPTSQAITWCDAPRHAHPAVGRVKLEGETGHRVDLRPFEDSLVRHRAERRAPEYA